MKIRYLLLQSVSGSDSLPGDNAAIVAGSIRRH